MSSRRPRPTTLFLLHQVGQALRSRLEQAFRELQITGIQYTILAIVGSRQGVSSADLSRRFFVTPQTMNEIIAGLERRRLIERRESPANRRILVISLTPEGRRMLDACDRITDRIEAEAFDTMPPGDHDELRRLLRVLLTDLRKRTP